MLGGVCVCMCMSEDNFWESFFPSLNLGSRDQMQVVRCGGKCLFLLSYLDVPRFPHLDI